MKKLRDLLYGVSLQQVVGSTNVGITAIAFDSRLVTPGTLFVAVKGTQADGHDYIEKAIALVYRSLFFL